MAGIVAKALPPVNRAGVALSDNVERAVGQGAGPPLGVTACPGSSANGGWRSACVVAAP